MKNQTKAAMAAAILGLIAIAGYAQTGTNTVNLNTGTYRDAALSIPQRIQLADAVLTSGTNEWDRVQAAGFMLNAAPPIHLLKAKPDFADSVLADSSLGGKVGSESSQALLYETALRCKARAAANPAAAAAFIIQHISDPQIAGRRGSLRTYAAYFAQSAAQKSFSEGQYADAIAAVTPHLGYGVAVSQITLISRAKTRLKSSDMLGWAKLAYMVVPFSQTQQGIDLVGSAFRALDTGLGRANAFIEFQKTGRGANPLADVALPQIAWPEGYTEPQMQAIAAALSGDNIAALRVAAGCFAEAQAGNALNAATGMVAQWLRNIDMNLVRANAFVEAQTKGESYTITELK